MDNQTACPNCQRLNSDYEATLVDRNELLAHYQRVTAERLALRAENAALKAQIAAHEMPVSDEELTPHLRGKKWPIAEAFDALIASRKLGPQ